MKMAGLYIHIPFCRSRCIYCGFYSTTGLELRQRYVEAVCKEISMVCKDTPIRTIYLGGGTPSQLTIPQLQQILNAAYIYNKVETDAEITIECNPDDVTKDFVEGLSQLPFNRVSMGAQTFCDKRLGFIQRRHNSSQVFGAVERLRDTGIRNISIDLMYGFPGETISEWEKDINDALSLEVARCTNCSSTASPPLAMNTMKYPTSPSPASAPDITPATGTVLPISASALQPTPMTSVAASGMLPTSNNIWKASKKAIGYLRKNSLTRIPITMIPSP